MREENPSQHFAFQARLKENYFPSLGDKELSRGLRRDWNRGEKRNRGMKGETREREREREREEWKERKPRVKKVRKKKDIDRERAKEKSIFLTIQFWRRSSPSLICELYTNKRDINRELWCHYLARGEKIKARHRYGEKNLSPSGREMNSYPSTHWRINYSAVYLSCALWGIPFCWCSLYQLFIISSLPSAANIARYKEGELHTMEEKWKEKGF